MNAKAQAYIDTAYTFGVSTAVFVLATDIHFDSRAYLKCMFGCTGSHPDTMCHSQPGRIKPWEYESMLKRYSWGILVRSSENRTVQQASLAIERQAFRDGYYFAFSLSDCDLCDKCQRHSASGCARPQDVRPSMHGAGIDVFKTVRALKLPLKTLVSQDQPPDCYALALIE